MESDLADDLNFTLLDFLVAFEAINHVILLEIVGSIAAPGHVAGSIAGHVARSVAAPGCSGGSSGKECLL